MDLLAGKAETLAQERAEGALREASGCSSSTSHVGNHGKGTQVPMQLLVHLAGAKVRRGPVSLPFPRIHT